MSGPTDKDAVEPERERPPWVDPCRNSSGPVDRAPAPATVASAQESPPETWGTRSWRLIHDNLLELERFSMTVHHPWPAVARLVMLAVAELRERRYAERDHLRQDLAKERDEPITELAAIKQRDQAVAALGKSLRAAEEERDRLSSQNDELLGKLGGPYYRESWNEEDGAVLWWKFPVSEPPYAGTPLDDDFPEYATHWTRIHIPGERYQSPDADLEARAARLMKDRDLARTERDEWYRRAIRAEYGGPEALKDANLQEARAIVERDEARAELKRAENAWIARLDEATVEVERVMKERDEARLDRDRRTEALLDRMAKERDAAITERDQLRQDLGKDRVQLRAEREELRLNFSRATENLVAVTKERDKANAELSALRVMVEYGSATPAELASNLHWARAKLTKVTAERDEAIADGLTTETELRAARAINASLETENAQLLTEPNRQRDIQEELRRYQKAAVAAGVDRQNETKNEQLTELVEQLAKVTAERDEAIADGIVTVTELRANRAVADYCAKFHTKLRNEVTRLQVAEVDRLDALDKALAVDSANALPGSSLVDREVPVTDVGMSDGEMRTLDELVTLVQSTAVALARLVGDLMIRHEMHKLEGGK